MFKLWSFLQMHRQWLVMLMATDRSDPGCMLHALSGPPASRCIGCDVQCVGLSDKGLVHSW